MTDHGYAHGPDELAVACPNCHRPVATHAEPTHALRGGGYSCFAPRMMPGQEPYTNAELAILDRMIKEAADDDPGEENEP